MKNRFIPGHPGLLIASLILAFFIWLSITNYSDPVIARNVIGIPINFTNVSYIESKGLSFEPAEGFDTISVRVQGNRSTVEKLSSSNITAMADLTQVVDFDSDPVMVPVSVTAPGILPENVTVAPKNVQIKLEDMKSKDFVLNPTTGDTHPESGFEVGEMTVNPEKITVRGSKSLVDKIDKINAEVDVTNLKDDTDLRARLVVQDKNGDELTGTEKSYLSFSVDERSILVHTVLYSVDSDVKVTAETYGKPAEGYQIGEITLTPGTIQVVGSADSLAKFRANGNTILIDKESEAVSVKGASHDVSASADLTNYLPKGIRLAEGISSTVVVNVKILPYDSKAFTLDIRNISKINLGTGLNAVITDAELDIRVRGSNEALEALTASQIHAAVDLAGKGEGSYSVPVQITLPEGYSLVNDVETNLTISKMTVPSMPENPE